ncbi:UDP-N-acetylglucosamine transferase subunit ALG13/GT2 family glycosyltransferase [Spinactinospora alkalitolerans]|uniref:UDP-N-acetylglucosamine transferase subunit ALG13/GT2 family glycosyltransferase n=1 Tax=Spinactinospora alkalitolerans TaxID=687207 RepID=A0A852TQH9_9ACTN|nr:glycosyltransferase [Spinactinospora alkalitolerans]NYE45547.1 UDP-N-acetylglucosamine transferase subunit ALG13/GT2 family glycosyltransferase [Spinactinospora alkalitolerans]
MTDFHATSEGRPLVLVTLGTDHHPFDRLVDWVDGYAREHSDVAVVVQHGASRAPTAAQGTAFLDRHLLGSLMKRAAAVVTHGGPATITEVRRRGRLPIAIARDPELGEHIDDHQLRFVTRLDDAGLARSCASSQQLAATLDKALAQPGDFRIDGVGGAGPAAAARAAGALIDLLTPPVRSAADRPLPPPQAPGAEPPWPEVAVVVPTRDRPELLRRTLRSIAVQDYPGRITTLVVYDHDAPDHSLADESGDRRVLVLGNTMSPGLAGARNTGILAAGTDLVAFCDDDDTWLPHKLRAQVEVMLAEPDTELVCCGIRVAYDTAEAERVLDRTTVTFADLLRSRLTELHPSTFLIRRDAMVHGCGPVNEEIPGSYGEDYELLLRLARRGPVRNVPEAAVRVLWHRRSHFAGRWQTISTALRWLLAEYPEFRLVPHGYARVAGQIAFAEAAAGRRDAALEWILTTLRARPTEPRGYLALAVTCGLPAGAVLRTLHKRGKGV